VKTVAYSCSFVPCELIAACGLRPARTAPRLGPDGAAGLTAGLCQYVDAFIAAACRDRSAEAIVLTTLCDQMRRAADVLSMTCQKPLFLMNVPSTWQSRQAWGLYVSELKRLGRFLESVGGYALSEDRLGQVMLDFDAMRSRLRQAQGRIPARAFSHAVRMFPFHDQAALDRPSADQGDAVPLAVVGGELLEEDLAVFDAVESAGGRVVLDATDSGERGLPGSLDRRQVRSGPLLELANAYFGTIPHAFRRPNSRLYEYLQQAIPERGIRGLIFRRYPWCDLWNAESYRLRHSLGVPLLDLDMGCGGGLPRAAGRIQSFLEMLCGSKSPG
jgi:benzoyl-CoA reductase/2-hydroxyglutaryl-CoA dehydratase subunit BcrC/BadD/HgdB